MASPASKQSPAKLSPVPPPPDMGQLGADAVSADLAHRHVMISEAAFFIAQARGFTPSQEVDDWLAAEREIERRLSTPDR